MGCNKTKFWIKKPCQRKLNVRRRCYGESALDRIKKKLLMRRIHIAIKLLADRTNTEPDNAEYLMEKMMILFDEYISICEPSKELNAPLLKLENQNLRIEHLIGENIKQNFRFDSKEILLILVPFSFFLLFIFSGE